MGCCAEGRLSRLVRIVRSGFDFNLDLDPSLRSHWAARIRTTFIHRAWQSDPEKPENRLNSASSVLFEDESPTLAEPLAALKRILLHPTQEENEEEGRSW